MTNQNRTQKHDDNADEASSLLLTVAGGGVPAAQKTHGVSRRAMIATTCFLLLGTIAVLYSTHRTKGTWESLPMGQNPGVALAAYDLQGYDPSRDYCFKDNDTPDNYCWYPHDFFPIGDWRGVGGRSYGDCGDECTTVHDPQVYDPSRDYCYKDKDNANKYCWYPIHRFPCPKGQWEGSNAARGQCGDKCSEVICYFPNSQTPPYTCIVADQGPHPDPINCF